MPIGLFGAHRSTPQSSPTAAQPSAKFDPLSLYAKHASRGPLTEAGSLKFYQALKQEYKAHTGEKMPLYLKASIRPGDGNIIGTASLERFNNAREGLKEHQKQNLHPTFDGRLNDTTIVGTPKLLGGGAFNKVYQCQFRDKALPMAPMRDMAVKTAKPQFVHGEEGAETTVQRGTGISPEKPRIADRNVATAAVNHMLGTQSVPDAETGFLDGKPVLAMSIAPGMTLGSFYGAEPEIVLEPEFQRQMSDIEVNAFLSANPDTHSGNVMIRAERQPDGTFANVKLTMIDNDMCFGHRMTNPDQPPEFFDKQRMTYKSTGLPAYMDARTASAVKAMDVEVAVKTLKANLDGDELFAFRSRASKLKDHVAFLESNNRIVSDWGTFTNADGEPLAGGNFFDGTLGVAGVQSGLTREGEPVFQPRSLIMRDMAQHGGLFHSVVSQQHRGAGISSTWSQVSGKLVPPTGIDHGTVPPAVEEIGYHETPASVAGRIYDDGASGAANDARIDGNGLGDDEAPESLYANELHNEGVRIDGVATESLYANALRSEESLVNEDQAASEALYAHAIRNEGALVADAQGTPEPLYANALRNEDAPGSADQGAPEEPLYANALRDDSRPVPATSTGWAAATPKSSRPNGTALGSRPAPEPTFDLRDEQNRFVRI